MRSQVENAEQRFVYRTHATCSSFLSEKLQQQQVVVVDCCGDDV